MTHLFGNLICCTWHSPKNTLVLFNYSGDSVIMTSHFSSYCHEIVAPQAQHFGGCTRCDVCAAEKSRTFISDESSQGVGIPWSSPCLLKMPICFLQSALSCCLVNLMCLLYNPGNRSELCGFMLKWQHWFDLSNCTSAKLIQNPRDVLDEAFNSLLSGNIFLSKGYSVRLAEYFLRLHVGRLACSVEPVPFDLVNVKPAKKQ